MSKKNKKQGMDKKVDFERIEQMKNEELSIENTGQDPEEMEKPDDAEKLDDAVKSDVTEKPDATEKSGESEKLNESEKTDEQEEPVGKIERIKKKIKSINYKATFAMLFSTLVLLAIAGGIGVILAFRTYNGGPEKYAKKYFELYANKNWYTMYDYSDVTESEFITRSQFAQAMENKYGNEKIKDYTVTLDDEDENYAYLTVNYTVETMVEGSVEKNSTEETKKKETTEEKEEKKKETEEETAEEKEEKKKETEEETAEEKKEKKKKTEEETSEEKEEKKKKTEEETTEEKEEKKKETEEETTEEKEEKKEDTEEETTKKKKKKETTEETTEEIKEETTEQESHIETEAKTMKIKLKRQAEKEGLFFSTWKGCLDDYVIPESKLVLPSNVTPTFDGVDISGYLVSENEESGEKVYLLGKVFEGYHIIEMECEPFVPVTVTVGWDKENSEYVADKENFKINSDTKQKMYETARDIVVNYYIEAMSDGSGKTVKALMRDDDAVAKQVKKQLKSLKSEVVRDDGRTMTSMDITSYTCKMKDYELSGTAAVKVTYKCKYDGITAINSVNEVRRIYNGENKASAIIYFEYIDGQWQAVNTDVKCVDYTVETEYEG